MEDALDTVKPKSENILPHRYPDAILRAYMNPLTYKTLNVPIIRRERENLIQFAENEFHGQKGAERLFARRENGERLDLPPKVLKNVRSFSIDRSGKTGEAFSWLTYRDLEFQLRGDKIVTENDNFRPSIPVSEKMPERSGSIHSHPNNTLPSLADVSHLIFDQSSHYMFITLSGGDIVLLRKHLGPVEFAKKLPQIGDELSALVTEFADAEEKEDGMSEEEINRQRLHYILKMGELAQISVYRIQKDTNRAAILKET